MTPPKDIGQGAFEETLSRAVASNGSAELRSLVDKLGDPPDVNSLTAADWTALDLALVAAIRPVLEETYLEAAAAVLADTPIGFEWGLVNTAAADWASTYSFELVKGINQTTRKIIAQAVEKFYREGWTQDQLVADILKTGYGPVRAQMIAETEITRAAAEGTREMARMIEPGGFVTIEEWQTSEDEIVCETCRPLDGLRVIAGQPWIHPESGDPIEGPPAHVRCRCGIGTDFVLRSEIGQEIA